MRIDVRESSRLLGKIWHRINQAINNPLLGAIPFVQQMEHEEVVDIYEMEEINREIQT
jgi:hypothetical protein